jgi:hypothetical protein
MIKKLIRILVCALLIFFPTGEVFRFQIFPNVFVVPQDIIVFLIFCCSLLFYIKERQFPQDEKISFGQVGFLIVGVISLIFNKVIYSDINFWVSVLYPLRYLFYLSLLFLPSSIFKTPKIKKLFYFSGGAVLTLGFLQFFLYDNLANLYYLGWDIHLYRMFSTFLDPNFVGVFYVLFLFFVLSNIFKTEKFKDSYLSLIFSFFTFVGIYLTYSRTALVSFAVGVLSLGLLYKKYKLLILVLVLVSVFVLSFSDTHIEGLNPFRTASSGERIESAQNAVKILKKNPVFGVGFNSYRYAQTRFGFRTPNDLIPSNADAGTDNSFLFVLATTGILGFIFFILSYISILKTLFLEKTVLSYMIFCSFFALLAGSMFLNCLFYTPILTWAFLTFSLRKNLQG